MLEEIVQQQNFRGMVAGLGWQLEVNKGMQKRKLFLQHFISCFDTSKVPMNFQNPTYNKRHEKVLQKDAESP